MNAKPEVKISFELLLGDLQRKLMQNDAEGSQDFQPVLHEMSGHYDVSPEYLLQRGFRKAYRQIIEGL